jgi:hypothetical protein
MFTFSADPRQLAGCLKAVQKFVSNDDTRGTQIYVHTKYDGKKLTFTATDGHTMCRTSVDTTDAESPFIEKNMFLSDIDVTKLLLDTKTQTSFNIVQEPTDWVFPDVDRYIPTLMRPDTECVGDRQQGFNAKYLARLAHVQKSLKADAVYIQFGKTRSDPMRIDISGLLGDALIIVVSYNTGVIK